MVFCCIPQISAMTPITSIVPLAVVLIVAGIKEIYEDIKRYIADYKFNSTKFVLKNEQGEKYIKSSEIKPGDFIQFNKNSIVPCDCIPLYSSNEDGIVYVETAALDGETNLKQVLVPSHFIDISIDDTISSSGKIQCEYPQPKFDVFKGTIEVNDHKFSINEKNLLLQGTMIKNTESVFAVVCYCGVHTKLTLNQTKPKIKKSTIDFKFNLFVLFMIIIQTLICIVLTILSALRYSDYNNEDNGYWYIEHSDESVLVYGIKKFFGYFTLLSNLIPISCQVSLEMVKVIQGVFFELDDDMKIITINEDGDEKIEGMKANSTALNDELGTVKYILSDKTGTLTENQMTFSECSINDKIYARGSIKNDYDGGSPRNTTIDDFLTCMAVCNTVNVGKDGYSSQSPDEEALCQEAKMNGVELITRNQKELVLCRNGTEEHYIIHAVFPFNSDRKRMSILLRDESGALTLWCKGADNIMEERCDSLQSMKCVEDFGCKGLRTLVLAKKIIDDATFAEWYERYDDATKMIEQREETIDKLQNELEQGFQMIGVSAIEDRLQDGVKETLDVLTRAGIRIWVITGDKMETAKSIGISCGLLNHNVIQINHSSEDDCNNHLTQLLQQIQSNELTDFSLIINANNVDWCLSNKISFPTIARAANTAICSRVSPLQKAKITKAVKHFTHKTCLTVGDGANDVPMISTGDVGVGIYGKEGTQAVRAADFSIRKFRHLSKLILYHGRLSLYRNALLIKLCFYKNVAMMLVIAYFAFISNFTCETLFDDYIVTFYNTTITAFPPIVSAIVDRDLKWQTLRRLPECNREMLHPRRVSMISFIGWAIFGVYQSIIFFISLYYLVVPSDVTTYDGLNGGFSYTSITLTFAMVISVLLTMYIQTKSHNIIVIIGHVLSFISFIIVYLFISFLPGVSTMDKSWYGLVVVFQQPHFYLTVIIICFFSVVPLVIFRFVQNYFVPQFYHIALELERNYQDNYGKKRVFYHEGSPENLQQIQSTYPLLPTNFVYQEMVELSSNHSHTSPIDNGVMSNENLVDSTIDKKSD
ncbi:Phospholipid-transporting ATPase [Entamoeba marina]